jgi:hypothetical protein
MKAIIKIFFLFIILNLITWIAPQKASAQVSVNFQVFYDNLSPYGYWVDNPDYGYVWVPDVSTGFTPYSTNGYWVFTYAGWTWVSDYSWGWATFHYGRWFYDSYYGWQWVPDNQWGPGWVSWRRSEGYYGWAPIFPGISISVAYSNGYSLPYNQWTFVRDRDFGRTNIYNYYINSSSNTTIINNSTVINNIQVDNSNNITYNAGPKRTEVQSRTGTVITPVTLKERNRPGQNLSNGELQIYRPQVEKNNPAEREPAPSNVVNLKDVRPVMQRNAETQPQKENQPSKQQRNDQPARQQPQQQQRNDQSARQQPQQQQRNDQPARQQPQQQQRNDQPARQQPQQQQRNDQPARQQPQQQQRNDQPARQQPQQPQQQQRNDRPARQQPQPTKRNKRETVLVNQQSISPQSCSINRFIPQSDRSTLCKLKGNNRRDNV